MLFLRRYEEEDRQAVTYLHSLALRHVGAYAGESPWDDDLGCITEALPVQRW